MLTQLVEPSTDFAEAVERFQRELKSWIDACVEKYGDAPPTDGHDQLTYTTCWLPWIQSNDDPRLVKFLKTSRDRAAAHFNESGLWKHGYWQRQEAHHGTEHYDLFLRFLLDIDPDDAETKRQILDATEHLDNRIAGIPEWFDRKTGLFRSFWFGTAEVGREGDRGVNVPEHLRCVNLCLMAYRISKDEGYLTLARDYAGRWADAIASDQPLPMGLSVEGSLREAADASQVPRDVGVEEDELLRAENFLASNATGAFLELLDITREARFLSATERLIDVLSAALSDPFGGVAADAVRQYRRITGRTRYDAQVVEAVSKWSAGTIEEIGMEPIVERSGRSVGIGVGRRGDMPDWFEDGKPRRCSPITLALAAEIDQDTNLATVALDLGRAQLALARQAYGDGRDHGCGARSISAIARGHGRENHAGVTTAVLAPLIETFVRADRTAPQR